MVILALVVVLAVVVAAAWKDLSSLDSVRRLFSYNKVTQDEQGKVEMYSFSNDRSNTFALLGDHLIVASTTGVSIYSSSGSVVDSMSVKLTNPAIAVGGQTAAVYDIGGQTLLIYSASGLVRDMSGECSGNILSVSVNSSDYLALNAEKSGYKSAVTVYDASGEKTFAFNSSEHYVIDAVVMRDCKRMAAVTLGESDGTFADTVSIYSLGSDKADSVNTLTGLAPAVARQRGRYALVPDGRELDALFIGRYAFRQLSLRIPVSARFEHGRRQLRGAAAEPLPLGQHHEARDCLVRRYRDGKSRQQSGGPVHVRGGEVYRRAVQRQSGALHAAAAGIRAAGRHGVRALCHHARGWYGGADRLVVRLALYSVISVKR